MKRALITFNRHPMFLTIKNYFTNFYKGITSSIAFYPTLIGIFFFSFAFVMITLEGFGASKYISERVQYIIISNDDTARTILSTIIGGIISLTVFTFSMVMLLLSQAASNYSPRVLPSLISQKNHQIVLGFFLGTIIYCLMIVINILPDTREYKVPGFAIFMGMVFAVVCLILFVYFLHTISKSIQISHILSGLHQRTKTQLKLEIEKEANNWVDEIPNTDNWEVFESKQTGYLQDFSKKSLQQIANEKEIQIRILFPKGTFILQHTPLLKIEGKIDDEGKEQLYSCFHFSNEEVIARDFSVGIKHITEIIVKAMSPGINDPGTALTGIDYLTDLFSLRMRLPDDELLEQGEGKGKVYMNNLSFQRTIYFSLAVIRQYSKHDAIVVLHLLNMFKKLLQVENLKEEHRETLIEEINTLLIDVKENIKNPTDFKVIERAIEKLVKIEDTNKEIVKVENI
ncbi:MAG: DUF2254 domain-containing protein [Saprospiraceae bacterium]